MQLKEQATPRLLRSSPQIPMPSCTYMYDLAKRNPGLQIKRSRILQTDRRTYVTCTSINSFFTKLEALNDVGKYSSGVVANFDESMLQSDPTVTSVIGSTELNTLYAAALPPTAHITLGVNIFADGTHSSPLLIYAQKKLPSELNLHTLKLFGDAVITGQPNGWITAPILEKYMLKEVLPTFQQRIGKNGNSNRGLLILDAHCSRLCPSLWNQFQSANVDVMTIVSHSSHVLQPLDLTVFAALKASLGSSLASAAKMSVPQRRLFIVQNAMDSLYHALCPSTIINGFSKAGIYPVNRSIPLAHPAVNRDPNSDQIPTRKRETLIRIDGDILTSPEIIQKMEEVKAAKANKRPGKRGRPRKVAKLSESTSIYEQEGVYEEDLDLTDSEEE